MKRKTSGPHLRRLAAFASGAMLFQAGGCAIDGEALLGQLLPFARNTLLSVVFV